MFSRFTQSLRYQIIRLEHEKIVLNLFTEHTYISQFKNLNFGFGFNIASF